jgi:hypothetical protein
MDGQLTIKARVIHWPLVNVLPTDKRLGAGEHWAVFAKAVLCAPRCALRCCYGYRSHGYILTHF